MTGAVRVMQLSQLAAFTAYLFCFSLNLPNMNVVSAGLENCCMRHTSQLRGLRSLLQRLLMM
jgi:hypothetical protein